MADALRASNRRLAGVGTPEESTCPCTVALLRAYVVLTTTFLNVPLTEKLAWPI